jgi:hypothetical protein
MSSDDGKDGGSDLDGDIIQNQHYDEAEDLEGESSMSMGEDSFRSPAKMQDRGDTKPPMDAHEEEESDDDGSRKNDGALMNMHHDEVRRGAKAAGRRRRGRGGGAKAGQRRGKGG